MKWYFGRQGGYLNISMYINFRADLSESVPEIVVLLEYDSSWSSLQSAKYLT